MSHLIDTLKQVPDFRSAHGRIHPLWLLLLLMVMGMLAGYQGYRPLETFVSDYRQPLSELLGLESLEVPSHCTFRRVMKGLDFQALSHQFEAWMLSKAQTHSPDNYAASIDGKRIRQGLTDGQGKQRFVGLVSLFAVEAGITLKLEALTQEDNSEIKVVQALLETLQLDGLLITMDALHAQKTLEKIVASGNDYLVAVKSNQGRLYDHLQTYFECLKPMAEHIHSAQSRGRDEHRCIQVYEPVGIALQEWEAIRSVLCVQRWGTRKGKEYHNTAYYISSAATSPQHWQSLVREHWGIENRLHWPKDVVFGEDDYRLEDEQALLNWSVLRTIGINILRLNDYQSLKTAMTKLANRVDIIFSLLT
ncbi:ISAs1 family transposase [Acaryochloris sp. CCMEE 5410]|uniref:ISAs1 family transposase n=1 Tax=Acaryochloris sp. CCMEE 5410 TaxID=310037 RepID=UPI0021D12781|nr:ISAs1 family transposase [Acaryochloris sp. CCMEE 5410]KAI9135304.1 ISAs1 family transposase [Acaryochloris sp. CCMEE 5410]